METTMDIEAIDLITGTWLNVTDFLGDTYSVRVPAGLDPRQRLKLANKGYYGWDDMTGQVVMQRQDLYIKLNPIWNSPDKIDKKKILALYNSVEWDAENES
jgi:DnaJ-class molecular chaperone